VSPVIAIGLAGSPRSPSRSGGLVGEVLRALAERGAQTELIDLSTLPADALLARVSNDDLAAAVARAASANILVLGTPVYRASYTGQLKAFFDLMMPEALVGSVAGLIATGASPIHSLAVDHEMRPLVASLGGLSAARSLYVTDAELDGFPDAPLSDDLAVRVGGLADELVKIAQALSPRATA